MYFTCIDIFINFILQRILDEKGESNERSSPGEKIYPDTIACKLNEDGSKLVSVYSNRSLFIWDIKEPAKIPKYRSFLAHSGCIWDIALPPVKNAAMPAGTFVTCSADHSIRFWNVDPTYNNKYVDFIASNLSLTIVILYIL